MYIWIVKINNVYFKNTSFIIQTHLTYLRVITPNAVKLNRSPHIRNGTLRRYNRVEIAPIPQRPRDPRLRLSGYGLPRMVYLHMLIMIGFIAWRLPANRAGERPSPTVNFHVFRQIITPVKRLTTLGHFANVLLRHLVFSDVPLAVVFPYELTPAVVTSVRAYGLVCVHVRDVFRLADESAFAEGALEGFRWATHVCPPVEFEVPLRGERLVADDAEVRPLAAVR